MKSTLVSRLLLLPAACIAFVTPVFADTGTWSATSGTWDTSATNWTGVSGAPWDSSNGTLNIANFTSTSGNATVSGTVYANQITYTAASGSFAINSGAINLAGTTPTISVNASRTLTISSSLEGSAGLVKSTGGTLTLSGSNNYTGNTTISGGVLKISNANALGAGGAGNATTISTGGTLELTGGITVAGENLDHSGGSGGFIRSISGNNTWNGDITISAANSRIEVSSGSLLTIGGNMIMNSTPIFQGAGNATVTGTISGTSTLSLGNSLGASAVVTLSGNNSYTNTTQVLNGILSANTLKDQGTNSSLGRGTAASAVIQLGGISTAGTLVYTGASTSSNRTFSVGSTGAGDTGSAILKNDGSGALTLTAPTFNTAAGSVTVSRTLTLGGTNAGNNTITGAIVDNNTVGGGIVGVIKADAGTWVLSGNNTYTGNTTISGGILQIGGAGRLGAAGNYTGAISNNASFDFGSSANQILGGVISGNGSLTKSGAGMLTLSGNNTYSGNTTISAGTLRISNANALGAGGAGSATTVSTNATIELTGDITVAGEALVHSGGSVGYLRNVSGNNAWNGSISMNSGRINSAAGLLTIGGNLTVSAFPIFEGPGNTTVTGTISGASGVILGNNLSDNAVVTFSGNNTYSDQTQVYRGTLSINSIKNIGVSSSVGTGNGTAADTIYLGGALGAGTLQYTGTGDTTNRRIRVGGLSGASTDTFGAVIRNDGSGALVFTNAAFNNPLGATTANRTLTLGGTNTGNNTISGAIVDNNATTGRIALVKADAGTWVLSGTNTYTGNTTVTAGTLLITGNSTAATGAVSVSASATLGGNGTIGGATTISGNLAPGNSIGTISTGNLSLTATGALDVELGRSGVTPLSDRTNVTGTVDLASGADLKLTLFAGLNNPVLNDIFFLISNDSTDAITGVFTKLNGANTTLNEGSQFSWNSQNWQITYTANFTSSTFTGGNDLALQVIPEPTTWALLAASLTTVVVLRRRRTRL